tara:strand:- start:3959 stop:4186 length:228 start_codon:yes stop_codon:yes gene_type:complete
MPKNNITRFILDLLKNKIIIGEKIKNATIPTRPQELTNTVIKTIMDEIYSKCFFLEISLEIMSNIPKHRNMENSK